MKKLLFTLVLLFSGPVFGAFLSSPDLPINGQAAQTASGNNIILATAGTAATDAIGFRSFTITIIPTGTVSSGVVTFEGSEDNSNFVAIQVYDLAAPTSAPVTTISPATSTPRFLAAALNLRYVRARISTVIGGGGSIAAVTHLSPVPFYAMQPQAILGAGSNTIGNVGQSGTWNINNISGTIALPTGAATAAKQPALGTAGTPSTDVLTVQGAASMTALKVDGSAVTQPVSGAITANAGSNLNTSALALDATLTGGSARAKITDGTNNAAVKAASTAAAATDPAVVVAISPNNTVASTQSGTWTMQPGNTANTTPWLTAGKDAAAAAASVNPNTVSGVDTSTIVRRLQTNAAGAVETFGPGESPTPFTVGTGASTVTDGTNGKTINLQPKEADFYVDFSAVSTSPTIQFEVSWDNVNFAIIPLSRIDNTAASQQYNGVAAFTPVLASVWRGKTYGAPILRVHLTAGTTTNTIGKVRVVYQPTETGAIVSPFAFQAASTTEAVGSANGQVFTGGVRTLTSAVKGATQAILTLDAVTGTLTYALEGSTDGGTTYNAVAMQPIAGGPTVTSVAATGTAALPASGIYVADVSNMTNVRAHCTAFTSGVAYGALKLVPVPTSNGIGNKLAPTYATGTNVQSFTSTTNILVIESGPAKTTRIKRLIITPGVATAATTSVVSIYRNTVAATAGGSTVSGASLQRVFSDPSYTGTVRFNGFTVVGVTSTQSNTVIACPVNASTAGFGPSIIYDFTNGGTEEGLTIPVGTTNGIMFAFNGTAGGAGFSLHAEWTEE